MRLLSLFTLLLLVAPQVAAQQPKPLPPELVAPTDALSPADERKAFTLPAGFDAQLVASEPDIQKPMQMAWDAKGRLWVTTSYHYPFAAPLGKGTDKLFVLSDFDPETGKAKSVKTFASDLNIPIGILPLPDCKSCIVSSVGEIRKYTDTDDDGKADKSEVLFSGFGFRDTHGMYNAYTLLPDGWVYSCHGFNNDSVVKGKDGHEVKMQSGNTFRFRPDGSRIEVYSRGQVNPFGMTVDPWFNLYTADCHSRPITQIIPGAYFESFGKPHDGLGYAPSMFGYEPGGTGMCGVAWYDAVHFPAEHSGSIYLGNVVTNRVHRAKIEWHGATPKAVQQPDLIASTDRWFRPVDIKLGPDGAIYIADFYNKIIGHYEVDLKHPARDKDHGRIWRVVYKGPEGKAPVPKLPFTDLTTQPIKDVGTLVSSPNLTVRLLAINQLLRRIDEYKDVKHPLPSLTQEQSATRVWINDAAPWDKETAQLVAKNLKSDRFSVAERVHMLKLVTERWAGDVGVLREAVVAALGDASPLIQRAATECVIFHPHADFVKPLLEVLKKAAPADTHLKHATRVALRNCLRDAAEWPKDYDAVYADMALAIPNEKAAAYLLLWVGSSQISEAKRPAAAEHVARYGTGDTEEKLVVALVTAPGVVRLNSDAILAAFKGIQARGAKLSFPSAVNVLNASQRYLTLPSFSNDATGAAEIAQVLPALKVMAALPTITARGPVPHIVTERTREMLGIYVSSAKAPVDFRGVAADVFLRYAPEEGIKVLKKQLGEATTTDAVREKFLLAFASSGNEEAQLQARDAIKDAPYRTAVAVALALASTPTGAADLLQAVRLGKAPPRLLQEKAIIERLRGANIPDLDKQIAALTKGLPAPDLRLAELIKKRSAVFASAKPDKEAGAKLFTKHCAACHKIGEMGGKIAPQLDGLGLRGLERILEDVLDPNRNVDQAFRARVITTKDEKTITGLMLRVEGEVMVIADGEGKEIRIPTKDIETNRETMLSPMPANFGDLIPEADFVHLLAYLLDQKIPPPKKE